MLRSPDLMTIPLTQVIPTETPMESLVQRYMSELIHVTREYALDVLPPIAVTPVDHYYLVCDGHHRLECLKRLNAQYVLAFEQEET